MIRVDPDMPENFDHGWYARRNGQPFEGDGRSAFFPVDRDTSLDQYENRLIAPDARSSRD